MFRRFIPFAVVGFLCLPAVAASPRLKVSENGRFLVREDGEPFFYLGDTAWELFHRLNREEAERYLADRAGKGFTIIQAVALAELDGLHAPNAYGHTPLIDDDPTRPDVRDGPSNDYWDHVDFIVEKANARGLVVGLLPTWGDKWNKKWGVGPEIFTPQNAEAYGAWLGSRYREADLIWILGGDRPVENDGHFKIIRALARGLRAGDGGSHLITFHPTGGRGSAEAFHADTWLDFNMRQNGHGIEYNGRYELTRVDYDRRPAKPVLDGEPAYEDHPVDFKAKDLGYTTAADTRRALYWDLFAGACGHTYGNHAVWQMFNAARGKPVNSPLMPWQSAIAQPGAAQMQHARKLLASRPYLTRIPDDGILVAGITVPGAGTRRFSATRDEAGSYAMVYVPVGRPFAVKLEQAVRAETARAWWFNPRTGEATKLGGFPAHGEHTFTPPDLGELLDWVLVLDDASKNFPPPGTRP
jgi:Protein of unknown function (DUF4038)/Putative collagen-binding domain of a collagenase